MEDFNFIEIDPKKDEDEFVALFEEKAGCKLQQAHDANILIQIICYYVNLLKNKFNDAAKMNLVKFSRFPFLNFLGAQKNCVSLPGEEEESYRERILLSPEGFTVAGSEPAYIYHVKSSHADITDVAAEVPKDDITVTVGDETLIMTENELQNENFAVSCDYQAGEVELNFKKTFSPGTILKIVVPHPYKTVLHVLTKNGAVSEEIKNCVIKNLEKVIPLCDCPVVQSACLEEFSVNGKVYVKKDADIDDINTKVNDALNAYFNKINRHLKTSVVKSHVVGYIISIDGVYDFKITKPQSSLPARVDTAYLGSIGNITYERVADE